METNFKPKAKPLLYAIVFFVSLWFVSCDIKNDIDLQIVSENNITSYLEENSDQFSILLTLLNRDVTLSNGKTIKYASFLNAYGTYTLFAPTNSALKTYLLSKGYSDAANIPNDTLRNLLNFHILQDTISTTQFTDGKLGVATMYGQYLVVGAIYDGSSTHIRVNKQANITTKNVTLGNGIIHVIDGVLEPATNTIAQMLENDGRFKIFVKALKATGYYDTLNTVSETEVSSQRWLTVMATTDSVYNAHGITDLKSKYCNTGTPTNTKDSLYLYIGYHIVNGLRFIADLNSSSTYATLSGNNVISVTINSDTVLINEETVNGIFEKGVAIQRTKSDNSTKNGVYHVLDNDYYIKNRSINRVFFDFCDYDDIRSKDSYWGKSNSSSIELYNTNIDGISCYAKGSMLQTYLYYKGNTTVNASSTNTETFVNYNYLYVHMGTARVSWIKFTTPFIAAGEYKVWLTYRRTGKTCPISVMIDSTDMAISPDLITYMPARNSKTLEAYDNYLLGIGYKRPLQIKNQKNYANVINVGVYLGRITLTTSSTHWLKIYTTSAGSTGSKAYLDYVEFIPVNENQIWPKYDQDGTAWPQPEDGYDDMKTAIY